MKILRLTALCALLLYGPAHAFEAASLLGSLAWGAVKLYLDVPSTVVTVAEGTGLTREKAIDQALLNASGQAAGTLIVGERRLDVERLVTDSVLQRNAGVVQGYQVLSCDQIDGRYHCKVRATVNTQPLVQAMQARGAKFVEVDGEGLYAQQMTHRVRLEGGRKLVLDAIDNLTSSGIDARVVRVNQHLTDKPYGVIEVAYDTSLSGDYAAYLDGLLAQIGKTTDAKDPGRGRLGISVKSRNLGLLGSSSHVIRDNALVGMVQASLQKQQRLDVQVLLKDYNDDVVAASCSTHQSRLYGYWSSRDQQPYADYLPRFLEIGGIERRYQLVSVPEDILGKFSKVEVSIGCTYRHQLISVDRAYDSWTAMSTPTGGALLRQTY